MSEPAVIDDTEKSQVPQQPNTEPQTAMDVVKSIQPSDLAFDNVAKLPCARNALLYGMGLGGGVALSSYLTKKSLVTIGNRGVGTFVLVTLASWNVCRWQRLTVQKQLQVQVDH